MAYLHKAPAHTLDGVQLDGQPVVRVDDAVALHDGAYLVPQGHQAAQDSHTHLCQGTHRERGQGSDRVSVSLQSDKTLQVYQLRLLYDQSA